MKKIFYVFVFFTSLSFSQGINLELNQVLLLDVSNSTVTHTVPEGKVWKVTTVLHQNSIGGSNQVSIEVNGISCYFGNTTYNSQSTESHLPSSFPIWLPEGTEVRGNSTAKFLSILEFNTE